MSASVAEFFSKEGIKKFHNGAKAFVHRQSVKALAASMVLASAFACSKAAETATIATPQQVTAYAVMEKGDTLCSYQAFKTDSTSFARLQNLVNNATKSETGCDLLKEISKQGTSIRIGEAGANTVGFYNPGDNSICLNPVFNNATLQSCLIHEGKHSVQNFALKKDPEAFYTFYTNMVTTRVMEADAVATQTKFSYEMAEKGDSAAWKALKTSHRGVADTFKNAAEKYGKDSDDAMKATMLSWYQDKSYVGLYDQSMLEYHAAIVSQIPADQLKHCFQGTLDCNSLLTKVCNLNGRAYAGKDGSILQTPQTAYLSRSTFEASMIINCAMYEKTGKADLSALKMYPLNKDGTVSTKTYQQEKLAKDHYQVAQKVALSAAQNKLRR